MAMLGLAFGSFLNVCLARLPENESIVSPGSHCRNCAHSLAWWENLPILSWTLLRGRCRGCESWIGIRYPLVEASVGILWTSCWFRFSGPIFALHSGEGGLRHPVASGLVSVAGYSILCWVLLGLALFDLGDFWLPNVFTLPGIGLGFVFTLLKVWSQTLNGLQFSFLATAWSCLLAILGGLGLILSIRLAYWMLRRQEGIGLGDAKLMAMFGAWLGLGGALGTFVLAVFFASAAALIWLLFLAVHGKKKEWAKMPLPLGTFLCGAALSNVFYPDWLWAWWVKVYLAPLGIHMS